MILTIPNLVNNVHMSDAKCSQKNPRNLHAHTWFANYSLLLQIKPHTQRHQDWFLSG